MFCLYLGLFSPHLYFSVAIRHAGPNPATLSGLEPTSVPPGALDTSSSLDQPQSGLVLGGGLPSIPPDLLKKVIQNDYVELSDLLPERIQEVSLFGDSKRKKSLPIDKFVDWVLAFATYSHALLLKSPAIAPDLITFIGTVARLARDHSGLAWASYERSIRANMLADRSLSWRKLDQEVWALALVSKGSTHASGSNPSRKRSSTACGTWNEGKFCPFKSCYLAHVCSVCFSPKHRATTCPSSTPKKPN